MVFGLLIFFQGDHDHTVYFEGIATTILGAILLAMKGSGADTSKNAIISKPIEENGGSADADSKSNSSSSSPSITIS